MKFGVIISREKIDRGAGDPYGRLFRYLNEMGIWATTSAGVGTIGLRQGGFGGDEATEP